VINPNLTLNGLLNVVTLFRLLLNLASVLSLSSASGVFMCGFGFNLVLAFSVSLGVVSGTVGETIKPLDSHQQ
jgi:hypothetical protein